MRRSEAIVSMPGTLMASVDSTTPFSFRGQRPGDITELRRALAAWLGTFGCDADTALDVAVAVNEAAANAIVHARSPFDVVARHEAARTTVVVRDRGPWRARRSRGYGLALMRTLADHVTIDAGRAGTTVTLVFAR